MVNVGSLDRAVRIVLGLVLLAAPFVSPAADALTGWGAWALRRPCCRIDLPGYCGVSILPAL